MNDGTFDEPDFGVGMDSEQAAEVASFERWERMEELFFDLLDIAVYVYAGAVTVYLHFVA